MGGEGFFELLGSHSQAVYLRLAKLRCTTPRRLVLRWKFRRESSLDVTQEVLMLQKFDLGVGFRFLALSSLSHLENHVLAAES